ncbi:MAG: OadG family protein [Chloroflexi bacterium]|nr:OadG family protein [Chloroflexota bacterium]
MPDILLSLQITALGMGLVFGAILLLWLMMVLLTALTAEKETPATSLSQPNQDASRFASPAPDSVSDNESKLKAISIAVAIALAEQGQSSTHPLSQPPTALVSAWQLGMRTSQRSEKGNFRRH